MDFTVKPLADMDPKDALIIVAFPSTGAASPITGRFLIERLNMPLVGHIDSIGFATARVIHQGIPSSPVRIHGGDVACEIGGPCRRVYVISTDVPVPDEWLSSLATTVLNWGEGARMVLSLEAIARADGDDMPDVFMAAASQKGLDNLKPANAPLLVSAIVTGMTAHMLAQSDNVATLVVEARPDHPDSRAAAALVRALDALIPQIKVDASPLEEDAQRIEGDVQRIAEGAPRMNHSFI